MSIVKHFSCEDFQAKRFQQLLNTDRRAREQLVRLSGLRSSVVYVLMAMTTVVTWYLGLRDVLEGRSTLGDVTVTVTMVERIRDVVSNILNIYQDMQQRLMHLETSFRLCHRPPAFTYKGGRPTPGPQAIAAPVGHHIELLNLSFAYPARPETTVLHDASLTLHPGTITALCG